MYTNEYITILGIYDDNTDPGQNTTLHRESIDALWFQQLNIVPLVFVPDAASPSIDF